MSEQWPNDPATIEADLRALVAEDAALGTTTASEQALRDQIAHEIRQRIAPRILDILASLRDHIAALEAEREQAQREGKKEEPMSEPTDKPVTATTLRRWPCGCKALVFVVPGEYEEIVQLVGSCERIRSGNSRCAREVR